MGNYEKRMGHKNRKTLPDPEPSKAVVHPKGPKKKAPRYLAERYFTALWRGGKGSWVQEGSHNDLEQAIHLARKAARAGWGRTKPLDLRVIDSSTGTIVWEERLPGIPYQRTVHGGNEIAR